MRNWHEPVVAKLADGNAIEVDPADYHGRILYLFGTNDIKVSMTAIALLEPGDVFLDIGANYSTIGLAASHVVGPEGSVHLFEPQHLLAERVATTIQNGKYSNVQLHRIGLMDKDGALSIRSPMDHSGRATFASHGEAGEFERAETCEVRETGSYLSPLLRDRPFGAKLDIEGSEPKVMPWLLAQPNLKFLIFEAAHNQSALHDLVRGAGMTLFGLERNPLLLRMVRIHSAAEVIRFHDLVALPVPKGIEAPERAHPRRFVRCFHAL
jgi:FkbM family methyltransferase